MSTITKTVGLAGIKIHAFHGYYPEEQILGTDYLIDLETAGPAGQDGNDELEDTVNYEILMDIVCQEMAIKRKLIETVAISILERTRERFAFLDEIKVSIRKLGLPMKAELKNSYVVFHYRKTENP